MRNLERAGVPRSVAMKLTGHKTAVVYRRYAIVCEVDLSEGSKNLARLQERCGTPTEFTHNFGWNSSNYSGKYGGGGEI
ncbi:MAG: hypothetical protein QM706_16710 [Nitrospira sp.]